MFAIAACANDALFAASKEAREQVAMLVVGIVLQVRSRIINGSGPGEAIPSDIDEGDIFAGDRATIGSLLPSRPEFNASRTSSTAGFPARSNIYSTEP